MPAYVFERSRSQAFCFSPFPPHMIYAFSNGELSDKKCCKMNYCPKCSSGPPGVWCTVKCWLGIIQQSISHLFLGWKMNLHCCTWILPLSFLCLTLWHVPLCINDPHGRQNTCKETSLQMTILSSTNNMIPFWIILLLAVSQGLRVLHKIWYSWICFPSSLPHIIILLCFYFLCTIMLFNQNIWGIKKKKTKTKYVFYFTK